MGYPTVNARRGKREIGKVFLVPVTDRNAIRVETTGTPELTPGRAKALANYLVDIAEQFELEGVAGESTGKDPH